MKLTNFYGGFLSVAMLSIAASATGVSVSSPTNGATVSSPVHFVATATTSCSKGVSAMGIYTAPFVLAYQVGGAKIDTNLSLSAGTYNTVVQEWDNCGGSSTSTVSITVVGGQTGVFVTSPANNSGVSSPVHFAASAVSSCSKGVAAMGIYTAPYVLAYQVSGSSINTDLALSPGTYNTVVTEWDNCGGASTAPIKITVNNTGGNVFSSLQAGVGWTGYALLPPDYPICNSCKPTGPEATWSMTQNIQSPSMSGKATKHDIGGQTKYADILWNNHLIGDFSSQGLPDTNHTLVPTLRNFTYDVYFYGTNLETSQALEFDLNQFFNGMGFIWGHECRIAGGHEWDTWDNINNKWVPTGVACKPLSNAWNHLVIKVQRTYDDWLLFQSISLNGVTNNLNIYRNHGSAVGWYGVTVNWQIDGNKNQDPYSVYLDNFNFTYQ
jgi:hypothetical protein